MHLKYKTDVLNLSIFTFLSLYSLWYDTIFSLAFSTFKRQNIYINP